MSPNMIFHVLLNVRLNYRRDSHNPPVISNKTIRRYIGMDIKNIVHVLTISLIAVALNLSRQARRLKSLLPVPWEGACYMKGAEIYH